MSATFLDEDGVEGDVEGDVDVEALDSERKRRRFEDQSQWGRNAGPSATLEQLRAAESRRRRRVAEAQSSMDALSDRLLLPDHVRARARSLLHDQAAPSAAPAAPTVAPEPNAAIAPAGGPSPEEIVYLSVGGTPFTTRRSTLCRVPDSALAKLFTLDNGFGEPDKDKSGAYFLNRNAKFFTWVHDYLLFECRLYDLPPAEMIRSVRMEADFWGLKDLVDILDANLAQPCLCDDQRVEAVRFVNDGPNLRRLLDEGDTISNAVRRAIAAVYIRASEDEFGQPIFVADGFSNLVLHNIFDEEASSWLVCDSAAKTRDNCNRCLLRCMAEVKLDDMGLEPAHTGVWMVRVCTSEEQHRFREVPELALRSVPRSIALSLEVPVFASL